MKPLPRPDPKQHAPFPEGVKAPQISDAMLDKLAARIRPVCPNGEDGGHLWYIEPVSLRTTAFTWSPRYTARAEGLGVLTTIRTLHSFGHPVMFKPSIAEVLAHASQFPPSILEKVVAFHTEGPHNADDMNADMNAINAGYQVAYTTFYERQ